MVLIELIWKDCGWGTIIFLAALYQVDDALYEAAARSTARAGPPLLARHPARRSGRSSSCC